MTSAVHGQRLKTRRGYCSAWFRFAFALLLTVLGPNGAQAQGPMPTGAEALDIEARPVPLNPQNPAQRTLGALGFLGGLELVSKHADFGGLSGLAVAADESHLIAITDRARWVCGRLRLGGDASLNGIEAAWIQPTQFTQGLSLADFNYTDSEALSLIHISETTRPY